MKRRMIACDVFSDALRWLKVTAAFPDVAIRTLPARLHLRPDELRKRLCAELIDARNRGEMPCCAYGVCFPEIDDTLKTFAAPRISCRHCFEAFLGRERFQTLTETQPGSFFVEKELIVDFDDCCWTPLELEDPLMRQWIFENYYRLVYVRQPTDPPLEDRAGDIAQRLGLSLTVVDADYTELEQDLRRILAGR